MQRSSFSLWWVLAWLWPHMGKQNTLSSFGSGSPDYLSCRQYSLGSELVSIHLHSTHFALLTGAAHCPGLICFMYRRVSEWKQVLLFISTRSHSVNSVRSWQFWLMCIYQCFEEQRTALKGMGYSQISNTLKVRRHAKVLLVTSANVRRGTVKLLWRDYSCKLSVLAECLKANLLSSVIYHLLF